MSNDPYQDLPPAKRRRVVFLAVLRTLLSTTVLVVLYYVLPLDEPWNGDTAVRILIGLLVFAGITVWQVRTIAGSRYPAVKAIEALGLIVPFYLLLFASTYFVMDRAAAANFTQPLTRTDALYFAVTVFSTVGFGDIAPRSEATRVVLIVQMLGDIALLGAGARVLLGAVRRGQQRGSDTRAAAASAAGRGPACALGGPAGSQAQGACQVNATSPAAQALSAVRSGDGSSVVRTVGRQPASGTGPKVLPDGVAITHGAARTRVKPAIERTAGLRTRLVKLGRGSTATAPAFPPRGCRDSPPLGGRRRLRGVIIWN